MDWYYAIKGEQKGPVGDADFQQLVQQGVIRGDTLVWRQGMAGWTAYGANAITAAPPGSVICASCGRPVPEADAFTLSGTHYCAVCKPQILQRISEGKPVVSPVAEETRRKYLSHEASVKSVGFLYYIGGAALTMVGLGLMVTIIGGKGQPGALIFAILFLIFAVVQIWVGTGLRRLRSWARIPTSILSGIGLLGFPVGTLINGYILYLVLSQKGAMVFSPDYQAIIQQTPHIKYRTSALVWIILGVVLLLIIGGITVGILSSKH
ncbi:MAG TPA: DUF4339 domain-containing protein [Chthoniobacter sp.]|jgi:hypothetical protein